MRDIQIEETAGGYKITMRLCRKLESGLSGNDMVTMYYYVWSGTDWELTGSSAASVVHVNRQRAWTAANHISSVVLHTKIYTSKRRAEKALKNILYKEAMNTLATLGDQCVS